MIHAVQPASIRLLRLTRPNPRASRGRQPLNRIPIVNRPRRHDGKQGHHQSRKPDVQGIVDVLCYEADEEGDDAEAGEKDVVDQGRQSLAFKVNGGLDSVADLVEYFVHLESRGSTATLRSRWLIAKRNWLSTILAEVGGTPLRFGADNIPNGR